MLTHFTRSSGVTSALDNLLRILDDGIVRGASRMIRGGRKTVCLFDAPLTELGGLLSEKNRRRYEPFGVAIDKRYAFKIGARPAIYMPWREARAIISPDDMWRVVSIDLGRNPPLDWSFEREWRLNGDLALNRRLCVALVKSWRDADAVFDHFAGHPPCAGVLPVGELFKSS